MWETHQWNDLGTEPHRSAQIQYQRGLTDRSRPKAILFATFLLIYLVTLVGSLGLIDVIGPAPPSHTPHVLPLSLLSFPWRLVHCLFTQAADQLPHCWASPSPSSCVVQMALMSPPWIWGVVLLSIMAYDRISGYLPPLLYHSIVSKRLCVNWQGSPILWGFHFSSADLQGMSLAACTVVPSVIDHYFCDIPPVLQLWPALRSSLWPTSSCSSFPAWYCSQSPVSWSLTPTSWSPLWDEVPGGPAQRPFPPVPPHLTALCLSMSRVPCVSPTQPGKVFQPTTSSSLCSTTPIVIPMLTRRSTT